MNNPFYLFSYCYVVSVRDSLILTEIPHDAHTLTCSQVEAGMVPVLVNGSAAVVESTARHARDGARGER